MLRHIKFTILLLSFFVVAGCSSTDEKPSANIVYSGYYSSMYYDPFWYQNDAYWYYYHPYCCGEHVDKEDVKDWWHDLDGDQQQAIKDKVGDWSEGDIDGNLKKFQNKVNGEWSKLTTEQKQRVNHQQQSFQQEWKSLSAERRQEIKEQKREYHKQWNTLSAGQKQQVQQRWYGNPQMSGKASGVVGSGAVKQNIQQRHPNVHPSIGGGAVRGRIGR